MVLTPQKMKQAEDAALARGVSAENLMEKAGFGIARVVSQFFPNPGICSVFCGKGNNGGDALVAAKHLLMAGWQVEVDCAFSSEEMSRTAHDQLILLETLPVKQRSALERCPHVVLDGLLGLGSSGEPRNPIPEKIAVINQLREKEGAHVFAIDFPSGLDGETGVASSSCVRADVTVALGCCKTGLLQDTATDHVGRLALVPLPELELTSTGKSDLATPALLREWLPPRNFDSHKGTFGRVAIIAGSAGYFGAAKLCCSGALHGGAGLVTLLAKPSVYPYMAMDIAPEIMVQQVDDYRVVFDSSYDAIVLGPGLVGESAPEINEIIRMASCPAVVDAGALDHLSQSLKNLRLVNGPRILTPHPGEMARIVHMEKRTREKVASEFVSTYPCVLLLKGSRSVVAAPGHSVTFNSTGTPGMGTGGMGDVLSGLIAALLAQGIKPMRAATLGAWLSGRAAEIALISGQSEHSLSASQIPLFLGRAFQSLRDGDY